MPETTRTAEFPLARIQPEIDSIFFLFLLFREKKFYEEEEQPRGEEDGARRQVTPHIPEAPRQL